jgi:hypothetical protein
LGLRLENPRFSSIIAHLQGDFMSAEANSGGEPPASNQRLQFERAEFAQGAALSCAVCKAPINGAYFQVNGQTVCPNCREQVETAVLGGSKGARAFRAFGAGTAAAVAGFFIYWGIRAATGYEFALVAILVGYMVGVAVRWGAHHRGGVFYQIMAVALTYFSIASNYTPEVLEGMRESRTQDSAAAVDSSSTTIDTNAASLSAAPAADRERALPLWFELIFAFCVSLAVPFLSGPSNILGWIIIAVGLIEHGV